ncbi:MAG: LytTR family transcriptional regulator [Clostridia bacterium]|nr:LytTR family transcriptional regulator [Clostridia bacterium]
MFLIAVYEERQEVCGFIRKHIEEYAFHTNLICRTLWMSRFPSEEKRAEFFPQVRFALISLDMPDAQRMAEEIYSGSRDCRIVFFSRVDCELASLLAVRPIGYFRCPDGTGCPWTLSELIPAVMADIRMHAGSFAIENRDGLYILRSDSILYFQSELKNVSIQCEKLPAIVLVRKLSEIQKHLTEQQLGDAFIRIHQSYIVNKAHIRYLDKRSHWVELSNGERLPVSDSKYEAVRSVLKNTA